jgi:hypothetical protein
MSSPKAAGAMAKAHSTLFAEEDQVEAAEIISGIMAAEEAVKELGARPLDNDAGQHAQR